MIHFLKKNKPDSIHTKYISLLVFGNCVIENDLKIGN